MKISCQQLEIAIPAPDSDGEKFAVLIGRRNLK
jgi:hypothetical protein